MTLPDDPVYPKAGELNTGLTIREYMATQIMAGFAADPNMDTDPTGGRKSHAEELHYIADNAVGWADALIVALNKPK